MGLYWADNVHTVSRHLLATQGLNVRVLELLNVLITVRAFGRSWTGQWVNFYIDNKAVICALNNGRIKDAYIQQAPRSIFQAGTMLKQYIVKGF